MFFVSSDVKKDSNKCCYSKWIYYWKWTSH